MWRSFKKGNLLKVMIIGGGLFGVHIANKISPYVEQVDIFEYTDKLFSGASTNNQHRFHIGQHYPRSDKTIEQVRKSSRLFFDEFSDCIFPIEKNYYLIAKDSKTTADEFYRKFIDSCNECELKKLDPLVNIDVIDRGFLSCEKGINIAKLTGKLFDVILSKKNVKILFNSQNAEKYFDNYDLIVNCSYWSAHLTSNLKVKYELASLTQIKNPLPNLDDYSFTVMDGDYCSLYKTEAKDVYTASSVKYTPFFKTDDYNEFKNAFMNLESKFDMNSISKKIIDHNRDFFKIGFVNVLRNYVSPKIKLSDDTNDQRTSETIIDGKFITLLQGKITTIVEVANQVSSYIEELK